jgi:glycosyltransferase involved in cell wall biosynthesis
MVVDCHIDALAVALDRMHDADRASMGGRGRRHAAQALGWDQRAGQLAAVYQELIRDDAP